MYDSCANESYLGNFSHFDPMITLSGAHCTTDSILIGHATCQIQHLNIHSTVLIYLFKLLSLRALQVA